MKSLGIALILLVAACSGDDTPAPNQPPIVDDGDVTTAEDTPLAVTLPGTDPDGDAVTWTFTSPEHGDVTGDAPDLTYTPDADFHGEDAVDVTVSDGTDSATATITITVTPVDDAPIAGADSFATDEDTDLTVALATLLANDTDVDGDTLTITEVTGATLGATDVVFSPTADFAGDASFTYTVSDGTLTATTTVAVTVGGVNDAPVAADDSATTSEDVAVTLTTLLANDADTEGQTLSITGLAGITGGGATLDGDTVTFTPTANASGATGFGFDYTVTDGADTDTAHVTIDVTAVNDAPVAADDTATGITEGGSASISAASLLGNDADLEGGMSVTSVVTTNGTASLSAGTITYTPPTNFFGAATFDYVVTDGGGLTDTATVTVAVTGVEDAIVAVDDALTGTEDTAFGVLISTITGNDTEVDGQTRTITGFQSANGIAAVVSGPNVIFTPVADVNGATTIEYTVSDGATSDVGLITVTLGAVDDAPRPQADTTAATEDTALVFAASDLLGNDADPEGHAMTVTGVTADPGSAGAVSLASGTITFTPSQDANTGQGFTYTVTANGLTATAHVDVTITGTPDAPVAFDDTLTIAEDDHAILGHDTWAANDVDPDPGNNLQVTTFSGDTHCDAIQIDSSTIEVAPDPDYAGPCTLQYTVDDFTGRTDTGQVNVTITPVNDAPDAIDDAVSFIEGETYVITAAQLLANDIDIDTPPATLYISGGGDPSVGQVFLDIPGQFFTLNPDGYTGTYDFRYTLDDGESVNEATVTVTIVEGTCGDLVVNNDEDCDDDNAVDTDGCTSGCLVAAVCDATTFPGAAALAVDPDTGRCFARYVTAGIDWADARSECQSHGADLATPSDEGEHALIGTLNGTNTSWIGLTDWLDENNWYLAGGAAIPVTHWDTSSGEPNNSGNEDCGQIRSNGLWNDERCYRTNYTNYICELSVCGDGELDGGETCDDGNLRDGDGCEADCTSGASRCGDGVVDPGEDCDDGNTDTDDGCTAACVTAPVCDVATYGLDWFAEGFVRDDHCYVFSTNGLPWQNAQDGCQALGDPELEGYLVNIEDGDENAALNGHFGGDLWIGVNDLGTEGVWVETRTGAPQVYQPWNAGEPNDSGGVEDCAALRTDGLWNDSYCPASVNYICELEVVP